MLVELYQLRVFSGLSFGLLSNPLYSLKHSIRHLGRPPVHGSLQPLVMLCGKQYVSCPAVLGDLDRLMVRQVLILVEVSLEFQVGVWSSLSDITRKGKLYGKRRSLACLTSLLHKLIEVFMPRVHLGPFYRLNHHFYRRPIGF